MQLIQGGNNAYTQKVIITTLTADLKRDKEIILNLAVEFALQI